MNSNRNEHTFPGSPHWPVNVAMFVDLLRGVDMLLLTISEIR